MLNSQELVNFITDKLNEIGSKWHEPFSFKLVAEVGEDTGEADIRGILRTDSAEYVPAFGQYTEGKYAFTVDLLVPAVRTNYQVLQVEQIVGELAKQNQNTVYQFSDGKGIITFDAGKTGTYQVAYGTADTVPVTFTVHVTYTENAVTSADKHWFLDDVEIPFLSESVTLEREGEQKNVYSYQQTTLLLTAQTKYYTFRIPYDSEFAVKVQKNILNSTINQSDGSALFQLKYYDGAEFTQEAPYTASVTILKGSSASQRPDSSEFEITFVDCSGTFASYQLGLLDFPFDMNGEDTRYFNSVEEQQEYFENKVGGGSAPFISIPAVNLESLFITQQIYQGDAGKITNQFDYVNKNYAVIKMTSGSEIKYFYYFITKSTIGAGGKMLLDLQLDTVQTFFFDPEISFSDCLIERAHLNRFENWSTTTDRVEFVSDPASKIFNVEEGMDFPKRLVSREKINLKFTEESTGNNFVDKWLNENVAYWVYIFIDPTATYKVAKLGEVIGDENTGIELPSNRPYGYNKYPTGIDGATNCICYPIYKNGLINPGATSKNVIIFETKLYGENKTIDIILNNNLNEFENNNNDTSYYYMKKISILPPFDKFWTDSVISIDGNNCLIISALGQGSNEASVEKYNNTRAGFGPNNFFINPGDDKALIFGSNQTRKAIQTETYSILENFPIEKKNIIKQQPPNPEYNPKLNSQNFKELVITAANGEEFAYDIQKIATNYIYFLYSEPIQPEITRYYMRLPSLGLYGKGSDENYTGLVGSTDNGLAFTNDQYAAFLANNKNFFMQSNFKLLTGATKSIFDITGKALTGKVSEAAGSGLSMGLDIAQSLIDRSMTIDNMKNAPDQMKNANGNVIFNMFATDLGLYVEKYSALEGDLKTANDFMNLYGFSFDSIANVKDYVHIRKYHNYVKAQLQGITGNISNTARDDLRQRFAKGIRFWNQDEISYQYENYELWLED